jgi:alkylation response protein AidB-like acyl-CoA dehydrogenase
MEFALTEEQQELAKTVRAVLDRHADSAAVRAAAGTERGFDAALWRVLAEEVGAASLSIPEEFGGAGFTWFETAIVLEALGYSLAPTPMLSSVILAADALLLSGASEACERLLPGIADGSTVATVAWAGTAGTWRTDGSDVTATPGATPGEAWRLDGTAVLVLDGATADVVLVVAGTPSGVGLFELEGEEGLVREAVSAVDPALRFATLRLDAAPARLLLDDAEELLAALLRRASVAVACLQVGVAQRGLDMTVEYSRQRVQFGRPIGSFQALKHRMADMLLDVETSRTLAWAAAWSVSTEADDIPERAALAKAWCSDALSRVASETVQLHGGIAITWEHDAQLVFKRAHALGQLFGQPSAHRREYGRLLGLVAR